MKFIIAAVFSAALFGTTEAQRFRGGRQRFWGTSTTTGRAATGQEAVSRFAVSARTGGLRQAATQEEATSRFASRAGGLRQRGDNAEERSNVLEECQTEIATGCTMDFQITELLDALVALKAAKEEAIAAGETPEPMDENVKLMVSAARQCVQTLKDTSAIAEDCKGVSSHWVRARGMIVLKRGLRTCMFGRGSTGARNGLDTQ